MMERRFWSDGVLTHVVHLGWRRLESFCGAVPVTDKTHDRPIDLRHRAPGPATCLECTANESKERAWGNITTR